MRRSTSFLLSSCALALVLALTTLVAGAAASTGTTSTGPAAEAPAVISAATGRLCVTKFNDLNGDGQQGASEPTLSGWEFTIRSLGGAVLGTITTTGAARTCADVPAATVTVSETLQAGWTPTSPATGSRTVAITAGQTATVTFGNRQAQTGTLCVTKFNDLNGDGQQGASEPTLGGWVFTIVDLAGNVVGTITTTALAGRTCTDVPTGTFVVSETPQSGWTPTVPADGRQIVTITAGQTATLTFGNRQGRTGTLCITKFNDLNGDGARGANEPTLGGWVFTVKDPYQNVVGTLTTSVAGARTCTDLPAGMYTVTETAQAGWTPTVPAGGTQTVTIAAGTTTTLTFGNRQGRTGTLCITKFNDLNGDGQQGASEPGLTGWVFTARSASGAETTITTGDFARTCTDLPAGTYTVSETQQAGWTPTVPAGGSQSVTVTAGQQTAVTFGNRQTPTGALILAASSPYMNNNAINWGEYVDLTTTGPIGTMFSMQVTTDNVKWETLTNSSGSPLSFTIGSGGTSTYRYTPVRNYWYRSVAGSMTSNSPRVTVRQTIALRPTHSGTKTIGRGTMTEFMATVRPSRPELQKADVVFELWQKRSGSWYRVQTATEMIDGNGVADWTWSATSSGSFYVRAQALPTPVNANSFWSPKEYYNVR
jgi:uncharacterized protein (DUF2141 family)